MAGLGRINRSSVAWKLTAINTLVSGAALLLAGVAFGAYDRTTFREGVVRNLSIQAQIVASGSISALVFNDSATAAVTLAALSAAPSIESAEIYAADGRSFATYRRSAGAPGTVPIVIPLGVAEVHRFGDQQIVLARRILFHGKPAGTVAISSDVQELTSRRQQYVAIILTVLTVALMAAGVMSWLSQRSISGPIANLAAMARQVSRDKDYSTRAEVVGDADEIVVLINAFNDMLTEIQQRDQSLRDAHDALEMRVRQRTAELDAANKELEAFSYTVSHDLRAPLRHVVGFAGLLEEHAKERVDEQSRKYLRTITTAARRMGQLIDDLLAFSRIGRGHLSKRHVSLNELVRDVRQHVIEEHNGGDRPLEWRVANLPDVEGDPAMLTLVMTNLLSNAVKYTGPRTAALIEIGAKNGSPDEVVIFVRDNGVGFDMQYVHKLFGVFQRLHTSDEFEGTGIGLANVQRIIMRHGGRVWAESTLDQGATFFFSLPTKGTPA